MMSSNSTDWTQFYHQNLSNQVLPPGRTLSGSMFGHRLSDATVVTTATTTPNPSSASHLSPEGRVAKPLRRRPRASRRTPTTLLNTDTTNFRAMVQQFTGGPSAPFASSGPSQINTTNFNFSLGSARQVHVNPTALMMPASYHWQFQQAQHQNQHQQQQQQQASYMFSLGNNGFSPPADHRMFLHRLGNPRPPTSIEASDDGFVAEGAAVRAALPSTNENRSNTFLF